MVTGGRKSAVSPLGYGAQALSCALYSQGYALAGFTSTKVS